MTTSAPRGPISSRSAASTSASTATTRGGAEAKRPIQPLAGEVHDDDLGIGERDQAGEDERADRTGAEEDDAVAVLDSRLSGRVQPDRERLRDSGGIQARSPPESDERRGGDGDVLGESAVDVQAVRHVALAEVRPALAAAAAFAARDACARGRRRSPTANPATGVVREGDDLADELMPDHERALMAADRDAGDRSGT